MNIIGNKKQIKASSEPEFLIRQIQNKNIKFKEFINGLSEVLDDCDIQKIKQKYAILEKNDLNEELLLQFMQADTKFEQ